MFCPLSFFDPWLQKTKTTKPLLEKLFSLYIYCAVERKPIDLEDPKFVAIIRETDSTMRLSLCKLILGVH